MIEAALPIAVAVSALLVAAARSRGEGAPVVYEMTFPRTVEAAELVAAYRSLAGLLPPLWRRIVSGTPVVAIEVRADAAGISHRLAVEGPRAPQVTAQLTAAIPGLRIAPAHATSMLHLGLVRDLRVVGAGDLRTDAIPASANGLLASLQPLSRDEGVVVQYVLAPVGRPVLGWLLRAREQANPRSPEPELAVALRIGIDAPAGRAELLAARVLGSFHAAASADARLARRLVPSATAARALVRLQPGRGGGARLPVDQLAAISAVPVKGPTLPGLSLVGARPLPPSATIPSRGLVLGDALVADARRPLAVSHAESRRGVHICAPTGAGKSTVLLNLASQIMATGETLIVIDSKGDLAAEVADRVPSHRVKDTLFFDPANESVLGFNLLGAATDADLIVEHVVGQFRARYGSAGLGPRSEDILRSALLTLARRGGMTLTEAEPLLSNASFRQRLTADLEEPILENFWAWFSSLSEPARAEAIAPLSNKLRTYTLARRVRTVIGQASGLDLGEVLDSRKILLVSLARGVVGDDAAGLLGAALVSRLWHVIQGRAAVQATQRVAATVICDEFQDFAASPLAFETAIAQSRGYGVGWILAHQNLAQLDARLRQAVLANCRTRLVMQTTAGDASVFAREFAPLLKAADLQGLGAYEGYATISAGAAVAPPVSLRTRPAPEPTGSLPEIRARSAEQGMSSSAVDAAIRARLTRGQRTSPVGGRRRS